MKDLVSIIITTRNSELSLTSCLQSLKQQTYKDLEIIVVDNYSTDNTFAIAKKFTPHVYKKGPERSAQRNLGAKKAKGKFLFFVDSDMEVSEKVIQECIETIRRNKKIKAVVIPEESFGEGFWTACKKLERSFYVGSIGINWLEGARFFDKKTFDFLKGYDELNTGTEDYDLPQRIEALYGKDGIKRISQFIYHNEGRLSLWRTLKKKFYYGRDLGIYKNKIQNKLYFKKQKSIKERYKIFFSQPQKLLKDYRIGLGMLFMKTAEFVAGGVGYIFGQLRRMTFPQWGMVILCTVIFISHTLYVMNTYQYPTWDEHHYLSHGIYFYQIIHNHSIILLQGVGKTIRERQPLYSIFIMIALFIFRTDNPYKVALFINIFFYLETIIFIYFLSKRYVDELLSLLAATLFAFYGFPLFYLHFTYAETAATAFITGAIFLLTRSQGFLNTKNVIYFSFFFCAAFLTRWASPIFIVGPFLLTIFFNGRELLTLWKKRLGNIFIFLIIGIIIPCVTYYIPNLRYMIIYVNANLKGSPDWVRTINYLPQGLQNTFSVHSIMFYFNILSQQTVFLFSLFIIGFIICMGFIKKYLFFIVWFIVPYSFFTFFSVFKDDRFIVPLYPVMAVISVVPFAYIRNIKLKIIMIFLTLVISIFNFLAASWGIGPMGRQGLKDIVLPKFIPHPRRIYLTPLVWPPRQDTNAATVLSELYKLSPDKSKPVLFLYTFHDSVLESAMDNIAMYEKPDLLRLVQSQKFMLFGIDNSDTTKIINTIQSADYLLIKNRLSLQKDEMYSQDTSAIRLFYNKLGENEHYLPSSYKKVAQVFLPLDKTTVFIYKKTNDVNSEEWVKFFNL